VLWIPTGIAGNSGMNMVDEDLDGVDERVTQPEEQPHSVCKEMIFHIGMTSLLELKCHARRSQPRKAEARHRQQGVG